MSPQKHFNDESWKAFLRGEIKPIPQTRQIAYRGLQYFRETFKTESAFYLRFQTLSKPCADALKKMWGCNTEMDLFSRICHWWAVKAA